MKQKQCHAGLFQEGISWPGAETTGKTLSLVPPTLSLCYHGGTEKTLSILYLQLKWTILLQNMDDYLAIDAETTSSV